MRFDFFKYALLLFLLPVCVLGQINEHFDKSPWSFSPNWQGDTALWLATNGQLQTNAAIAGNIWLSCDNNLKVSKEVEFKVNLKFNPSGSNYADIVLWQNHANPALSDTSLYVRLGGTKDDLRVYFKQGTKLLTLFDGHDDLLSHSDNTLRLKFQTETSNQTIIYLDSTIAGNQYSNYGSFIFPVSARKGYFSLHPVFTASKTFLNRHFFDDIYIGKLRKDTIPPSLMTVSLLDSNQLSLTFSEPLRRDLLHLSWFNIPDFDYLKSLKYDTVNKTMITLEFSHAFLFNKNYVLNYNHVADSYGNEQLSGSKNFIFKKMFNGNIVINELMADPSPVVGLPEQEYIELFNTTSDTLLLKKWYIYDGMAKYLIPDFTFLPKSYLILCSANAASALSVFGKVAVMPSWPSLNNDGDMVQLYSDKGDLIDNVVYTSDWYQNTDKDDGGYSLERINPFKKCSDFSNWLASTADKGGTPGTVNAVLQVEADVKAPVLISNAIQGDSVMVSTFDEMLASGQNYISTKIPEIKQGETFETIFHHVCDCEGNCIDNLHARWIKPQHAEFNDIVINEILFNPRTGGVDFVELMNKSAKYIDLNQFSLANTKDGAIYTQKKLAFSHTFMPGEIAAFTVNPDLLFQYYPKAGKENLYKLTGMPSYNDDAGEVVLLGENKLTIDRFAYNENYHNILLKDKEGVSLERVHVDVASNLPSNWASASSTCGFATPGLTNSHVKGFPGNDLIDISPEVISPDNDGLDDFMQIRIRDASGKMIKMNVIDLQGRLVKQIADNEIGGADNLWNWDGDDFNGQKVYNGPYFLSIQMVDANGDVSFAKRKIVVAWKKI